MNNADFKDTRILEAFDYIDPKYIAEVAESLKLRSVRTTTEAPEMTWRTPLKHWKQFVALASCLLLLSAAFPVANYAVRVITSIVAGGAEGTSQLTEVTDLPNMTTELIHEITSSDVIETSAINTDFESTQSEPTLDYLRYTSELEAIDEETMLKVKSVWAQLQYDVYYPTYFSSYVRLGYNDEDAKAMAIKDATETYEKAFNHFFDSVNFFFYGYLGTINDFVILASYSNTTKPLNGLTIGGVDFGTQARFYIYTNELIISLEEAYENNLVSYEELLLIKARNEQYIDVKAEYYANQFREAQQGKG